MVSGHHHEPAGLTHQGRGTRSGGRELCDPIWLAHPRIEQVGEQVGRQVDGTYAGACGFGHGVAP